MDPIGNTFNVLGSVDSTNNYAMAQLHAGLARHGDVYFTNLQTAGKGQRGKEWKSGSGNITLSCILEPALISLENKFMLSITIALGCYDFVNHYAKSDTFIKWPNDIYWRDRKAGGILIENSIQGAKWVNAVAGIGINMNQVQFDSALSNPVSLKQITGKTYDILEMAKELCTRIEVRWQSLLKLPYPEILEEYNRFLYKKDERVTLRMGDNMFDTIIKGVNGEGHLMTSGAGEKTFKWGEVAWVI